MYHRAFSSLSNNVFEETPEQNAFSILKISFASDLATHVASFSAKNFCYMSASALLQRFN